MAVVPQQDNALCHCTKTTQQWRDMRSDKELKGLTRPLNSQIPIWLDMLGKSKIHRGPTFATHRSQRIHCNRWCTTTGAAPRGHVSTGKSQVCRMMVSPWSVIFHAWPKGCSIRFGPEKFWRQFGNSSSLSHFLVSYLAVFVLLQHALSCWGNQCHQTVPVPWGVCSV